MMRAKAVALSGSDSSMSREQWKLEFVIGKKNMPVYTFSPWRILSKAFHCVTPLPIKMSGKANIA